MKIAVFAGGRSTEKEISLKSGWMVTQALTNKGYIVRGFDPAKNFVKDLLEFEPDLAFIALHGKGGEDGAMQGFLETLNIPYTGCGVLASSITMDKATAKKLFAFHQIPTPPFLIFSNKEIKENKNTLEKNILDAIGLPLVIKPSSQGSTLGIYFVERVEELKKALTEVVSYDKKFLAEKMIKGTEVTAGVIGNEAPFVFPLLEIVTLTKYYDYNAKYSPSLSQHIIPARISPSAYQKTIEITSQTFTNFDLSGFARLDFIVSCDEPYLLEINTVPGLTDLSLFPDAAKAAGFSFDDLIEKIVKLALEKK